MTDPIIKKLNMRLAQKVSNLKPGGLNPGQTGAKSFDDVLKTKQDNSFLEKLSSSVTDKSPALNQINAIPADDIQINISEGELAGRVPGSSKEWVQNLFTQVNSDVLKMDSIIEVLSSSNTKVSRRQLLAYQASIGTLTINTEMFSKLAQSVSQNLNTVLQQQV
ncbi:MAG: hypothetical protein H7A33_00880 [Deltaproteobacteria bacterium]|nr:hypothetical protein [Deltaproteobacteria bacterium]